MVKKIILGGAVIALLLSLGAVDLWYTRYRIPEEVPLDVEHRSEPFVLHQESPYCQRAMSLHENDYIRPVFKLLSNGNTLPAIIKIRDTAITRQELSAILEMKFKTHPERTAFVLTSPEITPAGLDDILQIMQNSPFVEHVCVVDSPRLPAWFPKTPEPRGRL